MPRANIRTWGASKIGDLLKIHRAACNEVKVITIERTPEDKGDAKRSWGDNGVPTFGKIYKLGSASPYIIPLEYGWSPQARNPDGMVRRTAREWDEIVRGNVNEFAR